MSGLVFDPPQRPVCLPRQQGQREAQPHGRRGLPDPLTSSQSPLQASTSAALVMDENEPGLIRTNV